MKDVNAFVLDLYRKYDDITKRMKSDAPTKADIDGINDVSKQLKSISKSDAKGISNANKLRLDDISSTAQSLSRFFMKNCLGVHLYSLFSKLIGYQSGEPTSQEIEHLRIVYARDPAYITEVFSQFLEYEGVNESAPEVIQTMEKLAFKNHPLNQQLV